MDLLSTLPERSWASAFATPEPLIHGVFLALGLVVPLGPQNMFVFNQGANSLRFRNALPAVVTAALCDTALIVLAVAGVSAAILQLPFLRNLLIACGVAFLTYVGWATWNSRSDTHGDSNVTNRCGGWKQIAFCCSVSLLNPHAVLDTLAVIGTNSLLYTGPPKATFALATVSVSWIWFLALALTGRIAGRFGRVRSWLNRVSAVLMWATAAYLMTQF